MNINISKKQRVGIVVFIAILIGIASFIYFTNRPNTNGDEIHTNRTLVENPPKEEVVSVSKDKSEPIYSTKMIKAYVCGYVVSPGVYEVSGGDRLVDLVSRAGGLTKDADPKGINLALEVKDQGYYRIPGVNEISSGQIENGATATSKDSALSTSGGIKSESKGETININTADKEQLKTLPRVGDAISQRIIDYREKEGNFKSIEDIKEVSGIGDKMFENLKDKITVE
ncbi:MAG: ComEA family DNA-binding protein [Clostridium sp.]|uniref:ComEA family DNA-binding protein n=1 Tax=Clostridium sp. TaxID=1506 RepID=UPI002FC74253